MGMGESDSKDIQSYARSLYTHKKNKDMFKALQALRIIKSLCDRGIKAMESGGENAEIYFREIF